MLSTQAVICNIAYVKMFRVKYFLLQIDDLTFPHGAIPPHLLPLLFAMCHLFFTFVLLSPQDNITCEISSDYIALWPTGLISITSLDVAAVSEAVAAVLEHALLLEPCQPSWLRTQADIYYGK